MDDKPILPKDTPADTLRQMAGGFSLTQMLYTAVKLRIADHLAGSRKQVHELAQEVNASPQALYRFLRMMVVLKIVVQDDEFGFRLSPLGDLLRSDHPESMRDRILYIGEINYHAAQGLLHAVKTGEPAFDHIFGMPLFEYFEQHPDVGSLFNSLKSQGIIDNLTGLLKAYDFSKFSTIVDVGGGNGALMTAILCTHSRPRGIIFDLPKVVIEAQYYLAKNGIVDRCQTVSGDFFHDAIPSGGDLYLLSNVVHDWDDSEAVRILSNCHAAMRDDNNLLLIEQIMPKRVDDAPVTVSSDISMLLLTGGRERTEAEYQVLLTMAGLQLTAIIPFETCTIHNGRKPNWAIIESKSL